MMKRLSETLMAVALAGNALTFPAATYAQTAQPVSGAQSGAPVQAGFPANMSAQARFMAEYILQGQGERHFVMIDKANARMFVFENGRVIDEGPVLLGKNKGDTRPVADYAVPAGQFRARLLQGRELEREGYRRGQFIEFQCGPARGGGTLCAGLHAVWLGNPSDRRLERLASPTIEDNNISHSCVNAENGDFDSAWNVLTNPRNVNREGRTPYIYILPEEDTSIAGTAEFFHIPQSYVNGNSGQAPVLSAEIR
jgi:hypothetical protein